MDKPLKFTRSQPSTEPAKTGKSFNWTKWLLFILVFVMVIGTLTYAGFKVKGVTDSISRNWDEIRFAMEKPELVKTLREDYQNKQAKLDKDFMTKEKTSEEKLVDEVVKRLETADSLK